MLATEDANNNFMVGDISVSPQHNTLSKGEVSCRLQPKVMAVLSYLAKNKDRVINNEELLDQVWHGRIVTHSSIQKCVNALRAAFAELDDNFDYIVYFSKQGYQLVVPEAVESQVSVEIKLSKKRIYRLIIGAVIISISVILITLFLKQSIEPKQPSNKHITAFTQVKPYVSNTGKEQLIEPHHYSERVAYINRVTQETTGEALSLLFIKNGNSPAWQLSQAKGKFIAVSWSASGRNLVAIDEHHGYLSAGDNNNQAQQTAYYSFHIFTLDFKAEKVIEKNMLSHWQGYVSSATWWDEATIEFAAAQSKEYQRIRYRYDIAQQTISTVTSKGAQGKLLSSQVIDKKTLLHSVLNTGEIIQFLDEQQNVSGSHAIPFTVESLHWLGDGSGALLLAKNNQVSILTTEGKLQQISYSPKVKGEIKHVRSANAIHKLVMLVDATNNNESYAATGNQPLPNALLENGGGFIYTKANQQ